MRDTIRTFQVSSDIFWGYQEKLDVEAFQSIEAICHYVKVAMKRFFREHNLLALAEKIDNLHLHMHTNMTIQELLRNSKPSDILYLCDHCE